jgi:hypothetical protein
MSQCIFGSNLKRFSKRTPVRNFFHGNLFFSRKGFGFQGICGDFNGYFGFVEEKLFLKEPYLIPVQGVRRFYPKFLNGTDKGKKL